MDIILYQGYNKPLIKSSINKVICFRDVIMTENIFRHFQKREAYIKIVSISKIKETEETELKDGKRCFDIDLIKAIEKGVKIDPILCNEDLEIEDGHHRYIIALKQGLKEIPVIIMKNIYPICFVCKNNIKNVRNLRVNVETNCSDCYLKENH